jgi:cytochrome c oxidase assembly protein subunit 15
MERSPFAATPAQGRMDKPSTRGRRAVARWLLLGVAMLIIQILLGGVTRLTGSGLSITEWKPILGAVPPLNESAWQEAFSKYQGIAQFKALNSDFTLSDFKGIYFWEWAHREWARLTAVVFVIGFVYFIIRRYFDKGMILPFVILFVLGGLQGAIGWIMVRSGLNDTDLYVSHIRLAVHFMAALVLLCYTLWFSLMLLVRPDERPVLPKLHSFTLITIGLLSIQLIYGAFMAGLKAASVAPTWPTMNGIWIPEQIHHYGGRVYTGISAYTSHPVAVQFIHRCLAYVLCLVIILWTTAAGKAASVSGSLRLKRWYRWPLILVGMQLVLGILTVLHGAAPVTSRFGIFEALAQAHQLVAMCLLVSLVANLYLLRRRTI